MQGANIRYIHVTSTLTGRTYGLIMGNNAGIRAAKRDWRYRWEHVRGRDPLRFQDVDEATYHSVQAHRGNWIEDPQEATP
jgi:hypothetical protein